MADIQTSALRTFAGVPLTGLAWSISTWHLSSADIATLAINPAVALLWISIGGLAQALAVWVGFTAVLWAMVRAFGGRVSFVTLLACVSSACVPLWFAAPAFAMWLHGTPGSSMFAVLTTAIGTAAFLALIGKALANLASWPRHRSVLALAATVVFLFSIATLAQP